jgi:hypothetical protein
MDKPIFTLSPDLHPVDFPNYLIVHLDEDKIFGDWGTLALGIQTYFVWRARHEYLI